MSVNVANPPPDRISHAEYVQTLRGLLPAEAFRPNPYAYIPILAHLAIIVACWTAMHLITTTRAWSPLLALVIGNSMSALAFLAHDLSHRSIVTHRYLLYPTAVLLWGLLFVPATLWQRLHTTHHAHTNSKGDPDRRFLNEEMTPLGTVAAATLFPNRTLRFSITHLFYWVVFPFRHAISAFFYRGRSMPAFVTNKPHYTTRQKLMIVFEFAFIALFQYGLYKYVGGKNIGWASIVPVCIASAVVSIYFFTNHGLKPVDDGDDILAATTTVTVPEIFNKLHSNFSYHTEHHLFPNMNPKYYPMVTELFRKHYPDRFHCIPIVEAWAGLLRNSIATPRRDKPDTAPRRSARTEPERAQRPQSEPAVTA